MSSRAGIVVVHFGDPAPTFGCVRSLEADPSAVERTVVVVDNSGNLDAGALPQAAVVRCPENPGFGAGANRGVATLDAGSLEAIVVLNHDVEVASGFLAAAVGAVGDGDTGAAGGPLRLGGEDGPLWYAGGGLSVVTGTVWQSRRPEDAVRPREVSFVPGAAIAIAPRAWAEVGGFDPRFFLYNEDLDLGLRLRRHGWRLRFVPGMAAVHRLGAATGSATASPLYLEHMARTRLRPFRPLAYRLYLAVVHSGYVALRAAAHFARGGSGRAAARALLRGHLGALAAIGESPLRP